MPLKKFDIQVIQIQEAPARPRSVLLLLTVRQAGIFICVRAGGISSAVFRVLCCGGRRQSGASSGSIYMTDRKYGVLNATQCKGSRS